MPELSEREQQIKDAFNSQGTETLAGRMGIKILEASSRARRRDDAGRGQHPAVRDPARRRLLRARRVAGLARLGTAGRARTGSPSASRSTRPTTAPARSGVVTGVATLAHGGRTMSTFDIVITDEDGKRVCTARLSCLHRDAVPGGAAAS